MVSEYVVLDENEHCDEQNIVDTYDECEVAAKSTKSDDDGIIGLIGYGNFQPPFPRGCFVLGVGGQVFFNSRSVGNEVRSHAPICRNGKFADL